MLHQFVSYRPSYFYLTPPYVTPLQRKKVFVGVIKFMENNSSQARNDPLYTQLNKTQTEKSTWKRVRFPDKSQKFNLNKTQNLSFHL